MKRERLPVEGEPSLRIHVEPAQPERGARRIDEPAVDAQLDVDVIEVGRIRRPQARCADHAGGQLEAPYRRPPRSRCEPAGTARSAFRIAHPRDTPRPRRGAASDWRCGRGPARWRSRPARRRPRPTRPARRDRATRVHRVQSRSATRRDRAPVEIVVGDERWHTGRSCCRPGPPAGCRRCAPPRSRRRRRPCIRRRGVPGALRSTTRPRPGWLPRAQRQPPAFERAVERHVPAVPALALAEARHTRERVLGIPGVGHRHRLPVGVGIGPSLGALARTEGEAPAGIEADATRRLGGGGPRSAANAMSAAQASALALTNPADTVRPASRRGIPRGTVHAPRTDSCAWSSTPVPSGGSRA